jgi:hypothetical protein
MVAIQDEKTTIDDLNEHPLNVRAMIVPTYLNRLDIACWKFFKEWKYYRVCIWITSVKKLLVLFCISVGIVLFMLYFLNMLF